MPKGFFTQCFCLLADATLTLESVRDAARHGHFKLARDIAASPAGGEETFLVSYRPDVNGYVLVDVLNNAWPDDMGDPKASPELFAWWSMGHYGPFTFPGGLARAALHAYQSPEWSQIVARHRKVVRLRLSYILGAGKDVQVMPDDYDSQDELIFLSKLAIAVSGAPGVLCHFNPNGETLFIPSEFSSLFHRATLEDKLPIQLWTNVRRFQLDERFTFMDTVGNGQMDVRDVEATFGTDEYDPSDVAYYLGNVTLYLRTLGREFQSGETIDGPGEIDLGWSIESLASGLATPTRRVVRLYPTRHAREIRMALKAAPSHGKG